MTSKSITKTVHLLRAKNDGMPFDIEAKVRLARKQKSTVGDTEITFGAGDVVRIQHYCEIASGGVLLHLAGYVPGERASTIAPQSNALEDDEGAYDPPQGMEYKDGEGFLLLKNHHVVFCSNGILINKANLYLAKLFKSCNFDSAETTFEIAAVGNLDKIKLLQQHGVSSILLSASAYALSVPERNAKNPLSTLLNTVSKELKALIEKDDSFTDQKSREDLIVNLELKLDGNTRASDAAKDCIEAMATEYIDESDVGWGEFVIVTQKGEKIRPGQVKLQKAVKVERTDKSVIYTSAWKALEEYFSELEHGMLTET